MRDGCAGFFTAEALAAGQGIVQTARSTAAHPRRPARRLGRPRAPIAVESYDDRQVDALRAGDLAAAFGPLFDGLGLRRPVRLPGGRMTPRPSRARTSTRPGAGSGSA